MYTDRSVSPNYLVIILLVVVSLTIVLDRIGVAPWLRPITDLLYGWGILLAAVGLLLGVLNVAWTHLRRIIVGENQWPYSMALVAALTAVLAGGLLSPLGAESPLSEWLFASIIAPGQATLFALLAFFMVGAAFRYLRAGRHGGGWMLAGALLMLTAQAPAAGVWMPAEFTQLTAWALEVPAMAALRGALMGSSIALALVAIRYMFLTK